MKPLIIAFEGLCSFNAGFVRHGLIDPLESKHADLEAMIFPWTQDLRNVRVDDRPTVFIGHSFGGPSAIELATADDKVNAQYRATKRWLITLDPRSWTCDLPWFAGYTAPPVMPSYNFVHNGFFMPGRSVKGSTELPKLNCSHVALPAQPEVMALVEKLLWGS